MVEKIRRRTITKKPSKSQDEGGNGDSIGFTDVILENSEVLEEAGWVEKCSEQRFNLDQVLN